MHSSALVLTLTLTVSVASASGQDLRGRDGPGPDAPSRALGGAGALADTASTTAAAGIARWLSRTLPQGSGGRLVISGVEVLFLIVSGLEPAPGFQEVGPRSRDLGRLAGLDLRGGISQVMERYAGVASDRKLYVFLIDSLQQRVPHADSRAPVAGRKDWTPRRFEARSIDGSSLVLREPLAAIIVPRHLTARWSEARLTDMFEHELGHLIHKTVSPISPAGYDESFGLHTTHLRTNPTSAFTEGFAEYTAYRFRDGGSERKPPDLWHVMRRNNEASTRQLLFNYWAMVRSAAARGSHVSPKRLQAVERRLSRQLHRARRAPTLKMFREAIVSLLAGYGQPPIQAQKLRESLLRFERSHPEAVANLEDEQLTREEAGRELGALFGGAVRALKLRRAGAGEAAVSEALEAGGREWGDLRRRSPSDLMMTEGFVAILLLELDRRLAAEGIDCYGKVVEAMRRDPYAAHSDPPYPVNLKELLASMRKDPTLRDKLAPIVIQVTKGALRATDLQLASTRESDSLYRAKPGRQAAASSSTTTAAATSAAPQ